MEPIEKLLSKLSEENINKILEKNAELLKKEIKKESPVVTGRLRDSFMSKKNKVYGNYKWKFLEYGTKLRITKNGTEKGSVKARPFVRLAIERLKRDFIDNYKNNIF